MGEPRPLMAEPRGPLMDARGERGGMKERVAWTVQAGKSECSRLPPPQAWQEGGLGSSRTDSRPGGAVLGCKGLSPGMSPLPPALRCLGALLAPRQRRRQAHSHTPCSTASLRSSPCVSSAVGRDPRGLEPRGLEPRGLEPRVMEARALEARGLEPRVLEPRVLEARAMEARGLEPRGLEPRGPGPNPRGPMPGGIQGPGPLNMGASGPQGPRQVHTSLRSGGALTVSRGLGLGGGCPTELWAAPGFVSGSEGSGQLNVSPGSAHQLGSGFSPPLPETQEEAQELGEEST